MVVDKLRGGTVLTCVFVCILDAVFGAVSVAFGSFRATAVEISVRIGTFPGAVLTVEVALVDVYIQQAKHRLGLGEVKLN
jgi:hypothetical protein